MKHVSATILVLALGNAVLGSTSLADEDTGVGPNGVALPSSPAFTDDGSGVPVDMDNIMRAETAKYFAEETILSGGNVFRHERDGIQLDAQTVIRSNFDLIYSYGVSDASEGLTVTVPEYDHLQLVHVFDEDHVTIGVVLPGQTQSFSGDDLNSGDHVYFFMRTQPPSYDAAGMEVMRARQDQVGVAQGARTPYVSETIYDVDTFNALRDELIQRAPTEVIAAKGFIEDIADITAPHYQLSSTAGWAGLPVSTAHYFVMLPGDEAAAEGACSATTFEAPDLRYEDGGYWSITVYNAEGWVVEEPFRTNSNIADPNDD